jgi:hypothetical protein
MAGIHQKTVYNFFIEPQGSVADHGLGQPRWQIFAGLNLLMFNHLANT